MCWAHTLQQSNTARATKAQAVSRLLDTSTFTESTNTTVRVHKPKFTVLRQATLCAQMGPGGEAVWVSRASTNYETRSLRKDQQRRDQQNEPITGDRHTVQSYPQCHSLLPALQDAAPRLGGTGKDFSNTEVGKELVA